MKLNFTSNKFFNLLYIDRRHSFTETTKLTFLFSNISNEAEDATEQVIFDYGDIAPGEPIIKRLEEYDRIYQYVTLQILDSNSANIDYHEINWLTVGVLERFGKGYAPQFHWGDPSDGVRNSDYLGNPRTQRRTEPFRIYGGYLPTIDVGEDKEKLDQLQRWAFGFPFVFCFDHSTVEQEAEHSRTVYWEDAASYQLDVIIPRTNYNNERANVNFALREEATIAEPVQ